MSHERGWGQRRFDNCHRLKRLIYEFLFCEGEILEVPKEQFLEGSVHNRISTSGNKKNQ